MRAFVVVLIVVVTVGTAMGLSGCGGSAPSGTAGSSSGVAAELAGVQPYAAAAMMTQSQSLAAEPGVQDHEAWTVQIEASDARVSGSWKIDISATQAGAFTGSSVITGVQGTWTCDSWTGFYDGARGYALLVSKGSGDLGGLTLYTQLEWVGTSLPVAMAAPSQRLAISGWIEKTK